MGFKPGQVTFRLKFEDPSLNGLVVEVEPATVGTIVAFTDMASLASLSGMSITDMDSDMLSRLSGLGSLFDSFAEALISWNVEDRHGNPVPATKAGVYRQGFPFLMQIIAAWTESIAGVPENLGEESTSGSRSEVASIPMEGLSVNPRS